MIEYVWQLLIAAVVLSMVAWFAVHDWGCSGRGGVLVRGVWWYECAVGAK